MIYLIINFDSGLDCRFYFRKLPTITIQGSHRLACFLQALGSKKGIERYAFVLPMDDCLAQVAIDFGGRPWLVWNAEFKRENIGELPTEMFYHFFKSFSDSAKCNLNISVEGENEHHKIESIFKAFAKVLRNAVAQTDQNFNLPSTKGTL